MRLGVGAAADIAILLITLFPNLLLPQMKHSSTIPHYRLLP